MQFGFISDGLGTFGEVIEVKPDEDSGEVDVQITGYLSIVKNEDEKAMKTDGDTTLDDKDMNEISNIIHPNEDRIDIDEVEKIEIGVDVGMTIDNEIQIKEEGKSMIYVI